MPSNHTLGHREKSQAHPSPAIVVSKASVELRAASAPSDDASLAQAQKLALRGVERAGWVAVAVIRSPVRGARGAVELLLHAKQYGAMEPRLV